mmetsp:Transcript_38416/g.72051  ORF Transcript_38416/g.72051 Transcript_38416/m.72051 type:complete len:249 (+) Transcript_38416:60-806(+)
MGVGAVLRLNNRAMIDSIKKKSSLSTVQHDYIFRHIVQSCVARVKTSPSNIARYPASPQRSCRFRTSMVHAVNRATALSRALDFRFMGNPGGAYIWNLSSTTPAFEQRRKRCLLSQASTKEDAGSDRGVLRLLSPWDASTEDIGRALTKYAKAGDCLCLFGSVGAGKSTFSRAFIRDLTGDDELTVASPTFMLKLIYDEHQGPPVHHFDLYRLSGPEDFKNLQLAKSFSEGSESLISISHASVFIHVP